jgi:hypothetical protein
MADSSDNNDIEGDSLVPDDLDAQLSLGFEVDQLLPGQVGESSYPLGLMVPRVPAPEQGDTSPRKTLRAEGKVLVVDLSPEQPEARGEKLQEYVNLLEEKGGIIVATGFWQQGDGLTFQSVLASIKRLSPLWYGTGGEYGQVYTDHNLDQSDVHSYIEEQADTRERPYNFQWPLLPSARWHDVFNMYFDAVRYPECISHGGLCLFSQVRFLPALLVVSMQQTS